MILVSATDLHGLESLMARIERLYNLDGSRHMGIVFLMQPSPATGLNSDIIPFMELQTQSVRAIICIEAKH